MLPSVTQGAPEHSLQGPQTHCCPELDSTPGLQLKALSYFARSLCDFLSGE